MEQAHELRADTRAPLIVRAPGRKGGLHCRALVEFVDMYPSLCELCGLETPAHLEGSSFVPLLTRPQRPWKPAAFSQFPRPDHVMGYAMRTDRYRYVEWQRTGEVLARELYDHSRDAAEMTNLAADPAHAALMATLSNQLHAGWQQALPPR